MNVFKKGSMESANCLGNQSRDMTLGRKTKTKVRDSKISVW